LDVGILGRNVHYCSDVVVVDRNRQSLAIGAHRLIPKIFRLGKQTGKGNDLAGSLQGFFGRRSFLEENVGALDVRLTPEELTEIDNLLPPGVAAGPRYTEQGMRTINR
jgi:hypothetical protein